MRTLFVFGALALAACVSPPPPSPQPIVTTQDVPITISAKCMVDLGAEPIYPDTKDTLLNAPFPGAEDRLMSDPVSDEALTQVLENLFYRVRLMVPGRLMRDKRLAEYITAWKACQGK